MTIDTTWAERALHHAKHIATRIGPRGATTPEEKRAADYTQQQLQQLGLQQVRLEPFAAPANGWMVIAMAFSVALWSVFLCWGAYYLTQTRIVGGIIGALLCLLAVVVIYLEATLRDNPVRRLLTRSHSYNAIGQWSPAGSARAKHRVVFVSYLDTPPAARTFRTPRRARIFRVVFTLGVISLFVSAGLYIVGGLAIWTWAFVAAGVCGLLQSLVIFQSLQADGGEFIPGANHNASGIGVMLALAERIKSTPLSDTEIWFAGCGSHTTGSAGLRALVQQHHEELQDAWFIGFEDVGVGERLVGFQREGWLRRSLHPALHGLLDQIQRDTDQPSRRYADTGGHPIELHTSPRDTVVAYATQRGFKSLCLSVYADRQSVPYAYSEDDVVEHLQVGALDLAQGAGWELLQQIDRS